MKSFLFSLFVLIVVAGCAGPLQESRLADYSNLQLTRSYREIDQRIGFLEQKDIPPQSSQYSQNITRGYQPPYSGTADPYFETRVAARERLERLRQQREALAREMRRRGLRPEDFESEDGL